MFLTQSELIEMTGYQKHQAQQRWLKAQRIPFLIGGDGMPRVMRNLPRQPGRRWPLSMSRRPNRGIRRRRCGCIATATTMRCGRPGLTCAGCR